MPPGDSLPSFGLCEVCCEPQPDVQARYFRLQRVDTQIVVGQVMRYMYVRCGCCAKCFRRRMFMQTWSVLAALALALVVLLMLLGVCGTAAVLLQKRLQFPEPLDVILVIVLFGVIPIAGMAGVLVWWDRRVRNDLNKLFRADVRDRLKRMLNIREWSMRDKPHFLWRLPKGETAISLSDLRR